MARSMPICTRRSTTERAAMTPSAAMPTTRPRPMKPWMRRLNVRFSAVRSRTIFSSEVACTPCSSNSSSSAVAISSARDGSFSTISYPRYGSSTGASRCNVACPVTTVGAKNAESSITPITRRRSIRCSDESYTSTYTSGSTSSSRWKPSSWNEKSGPPCSKSDAAGTIAALTTVASSPAASARQTARSSAYRSSRRRNP